MLICRSTSASKLPPTPSRNSRLSEPDPRNRIRGQPTSCRRRPIRRPPLRSILLSFSVAKIGGLEGSSHLSVPRHNRHGRRHGSRSSHRQRAHRHRRPQPMPSPKSGQVRRARCVSSLPYAIHICRPVFPGQRAGYAINHLAKGKFRHWPLACAAIIMWRNGTTAEMDAAGLATAGRNGAQRQR